MKRRIQPRFVHAPTSLCLPLMVLLTMCCAFGAMTSISLAVEGVIVLHPQFQTQTFQNSDSPAGNTERAVGQHTNGTLGNIRSFTNIDLSLLPLGATATDVNYRVATGTSAGTPPASISIGAIDPTKPVTGAVTWTTFDGTNAWTTPGGDLTGTLATSASPASGSDLVFASTAALASEVTSRRAAAQPLQFTLIGSNENTASLGFIRTVAGAQPADSGLRAGELTVVYDTPSGFVLGVDYGAAGQNVQNGFFAQDVGTSPSVVSNVGNFTVTLAVSSGNLQGRTRADSGSFLGDVSNTGVDGLVSDLVFNDTDDAMTLTIDGLDAGTYSFTGYFNDSFFNTDNNSGGLSGNDVQILDSLLAVLDTVTVSDVRDGDTDGPLALAEFDFTTDGINPNVFTIQGVSTDTRFAFNGFSIAALAVPEPASAAIWLVLGLSAGCGWWWMRRRQSVLQSTH